MRKIFISYRRADAEYAAGALGRELRRYFGNDQVFRDKEDIGGGVSWKQHVLDEIDHDSAMLVLIGKEWAQAKDPHGKRRLEHPDDPIRIELTDGVTHGATMIPILLENAQMPGVAELPPPLDSIAELNALRLRDGDWQHDLDRICRTLEKAGFKKPPVPGAAETGADLSGEISLHGAPGSRTRGAPIKLIASYVLGVAVFSAYAETHDSGTYWGLALLSLVALALAMLAYRDYQRGRSNSKWSAIGAMSIAALGTLSYAGWALDPERGANSDMRSLATIEPSPLSSANPPAEPAPVPDRARSPTPDATQLANAPAPAPAAPPNIAGRWKDPDDDTAILFSQDGSHVRMVATQQGVVLEGNGFLAGRQLRLKLMMSGVEFAEMQLTLSPDGRAMMGIMSADGRNEPVKFVR